MGVDAWRRCTGMEVEREDLRPTLGCKHAIQDRMHSYAWLHYQVRILLAGPRPIVKHALRGTVPTVR